MKRTERLATRAALLLLGLVGLLLVAIGFAALTRGSAYALLLDILGIDPRTPPDVRWGYNLFMVGRDLLLRGVLLLAALLWLVQPYQQRIGAFLQKRYLLSAIGIVILVALWLPTVLFGYTTVIGGERYWWLIDDMMISMRYGHNLASGVGLVWNPGEYVEGYTNFLWTLYMALVHLLPIPLSKTALVIGLTNIALSAAVVPLIIRVTTLLEGGPAAVVASLLAYVLCLNFKNWSVAGTETVILALLMLLALALILRDIQQQQPTLPPYLLLGVMTLIRSDALVLTTLLYGFSLLLHQQRKRVALYAGVWLLFPIAHMLFRVAYYGDIIPNTAHLKVLNWEGRYAHGIQYVTEFASDYAFALLVVLVGAVYKAAWPQRLLTGALLVYTGYIAYAGGDVFPQHRFFIPILPLLFILTFISIERLVAWPAPRLLLTTLCIISIPLLVPGHNIPMHARYVSIGNINIALVLKHNVPPDGKVAGFWGGIPFYYSDVYGIDMLGKNDPTIAHMPALHGDLPGHNKFDFDYSLGTLKPDVVVSTFALPVNEESITRIAEEAPWLGELYFNQTFRDHCLPYPVNVETWRTIFVCDWSPELATHRQWVVPYQ